MTFLFHKIFNVSFILILLSILSGCQLLKVDSPQITSKSESINYTNYYLSLTELSDSQMTDRIHQHQLISSETSEWQLKSILLFSLPHSPVHNPFTAKSLLNQLSIVNLKNNEITEADFAFFSMLKTQLNEQVLRLNELAQEKGSLRAIKQAYQLQEQQFQVLQQQIIQLKKIEHNINEHGQ